MEKKLYTQIKNEWRGNLWLLVELFLVSIILWYVVDELLYRSYFVYTQPRGFNTEHCYKIALGELTEKSADYKTYTSREEYQADIMEMVERLRRRPEIEAVSLSKNSHPYNGSNGTITIKCDTMVSPRWTIRRLIQPDFVRVFQYRGTRGETPEQLAEILERGELLLSDNLYRQYGITATSLIGKEVDLWNDSTKLARIGAALEVVRYADYHPAYSSYSMAYSLDVVDRLSPGFIGIDNELCVRVRADQDKDFIERLKADSESQFRVGNIYIAEVYDFKDIRRVFQQSESNGVRNLIVGMSFLMLNIFLGLLGTFWFRTQQRRKDIALHKICGATDRAVFRRLLAEGFILLLLVTPLAMAVDTLLAYFEYNTSYNGTTLEPARLLLCAGIAFLLIGLMIVIGICIPARKAMAMAPAEVLHDE